MYEAILDVLAALAPALAEVADHAAGDLAEATGADRSDLEAVVIGLPIGIGLAAASGFRVFVPLFIASIAMQTDLADRIPLGEGFEWIGSPISMVIFGAATAVEVGGYYVPWIDNLLDTIATPAAVVAGTTAVAAMLGDVDPSVKWTLALIAGGGAAGTIQFLTVGARAASTATTGGVGNPVVSTAEAGGSVLFAVLAVVVPLVAGLLAVLLVVWLLKKVFFRKRGGEVAGAA